MDSTIITEMLTERVPDVIAMYQFGSRARGELRPTSDIDLAVLARKPISAAQLFEIAQDLASRIRCDVDLLDLRAASTVMRMQIISTGQRLETRDGQAAAKFEMYAYADYARLNEERKELLKDITKRGHVYG